MTAVQPVKTVVFPVAGLGTRFLPATKSVAKELLPVVDRPLIQYAVQEAIEAGATRLVFVVSPGKHSIMQHFESNPELEATLEKAGKDDLLERLHSILPAGVSVVQAIQEKPLGLGHAVLCAREMVDEPSFFGVILPDDMLRHPGAAGGLAQLAAVHQGTGGSVLGVEEIDPGLTGNYGIVETVAASNGHRSITSMVEKPAPEDAPSNLAVVGRYVLDSKIFDLLESQGRGAGGEIQLTDGIARLLRSSPVYAHALQGQRYDCGQRLGMLKANIDFALDDDQLRSHLQAHLRQIIDTGA